MLNHGDPFCNMRYIRMIFRKAKTLDPENRSVWDGSISSTEVKNWLNLVEGIS